MRISTGYQYESAKSAIAQAQERMFIAQRELTTGKRINTMGDDPFGATTTLSMRRLQSGIDQYKANLGSAKGTLGYTDSTLSEMSDSLKHAYELAVRGANTSTEQSARDSMASEITQIQSRLLDLANSKGPNGKYLFSGQISNAQPFTVAAPTVTYNGDNNNLTVETGPNETMAVSIPLGSTFKELYDRLETLKNNLQGGNISGLSGVSIADMQDSMKKVTMARGTVGARIQAIENLSAQYTRRSDELSGNVADIEEVDMAEAISRYQTAQTAYQAALTVASQGFRLSLMDFMN